VPFSSDLEARTLCMLASPGPALSADSCAFVEPCLVDPLHLLRVETGGGQPKRSSLLCVGLCCLQGQSFPAEAQKLAGMENRGRGSDKDRELGHACIEEGGTP
jgi:hypothetical protein